MEIKEVDNSGNIICDDALVDKSSCVLSSKIQNNVEIKNASVVTNSEIGKSTNVTSSYVEDSFVGENCKIGPYAHIRPNSKILNNVKIGNFVEIKNSVVGSNTKISHMSYVGDAIIGEGCNIGCGVIFCNYDGKNKNQIKVGNNCFIGSNCNLIAPLNIADNTYICAGTTVVENTNEFDFVIGRAYATVKPNRATKYLKKE